jgi:hypothetical protein
MTQLNGAEDYFFQVINPNKEAFLSHPSTFSTALNFATSLFHFHEWLYEYFRPELEVQFGQTLSSPGVLWGLVEQAGQNFGYIRDITNASKHVAIGQGNHKASTGMSHIANTHIVSTGYGMGGYGQGRYGGAPSVVFDDGGAQISFDQCAADLFEYWKKLLESLTGKFYL